MRIHYLLYVGSLRVSPPPPTYINSLMLIFHAYRLFSCGTGKEGDSFLVEWNESEGAIKRTYSGFRKKSAGVVQFDTTQNHFLAVGEDSQIKFWDMDNINILTTTHADGGLPVGAYASSLVSFEQPSPRYTKQKKKGK